MATADDLDPAQSQRRANDQLRVAMLRLDEHIIALTAPTMELALIQKKRAAESGLEAVEPSSLLQKFISQAVPLEGHFGAADPGQLNPDASRIGPGGIPTEGANYNEMFGAEPGRAGAPVPWAREPSAIRGKTNVEAQRLEEEPVRIPSFGDWRMDALLKLGSQYAGKKALSNYETYASQAGEEAVSPSEWLSQQGPLAAGNVSGRLANAAEHTAQISALHAKILQPLLDVGFGASHMGARLGYTPQGEGLLGASHILGLPNPLSTIGPWASPAARQGLGSTVNAFEAAVGGTGIGIGEEKNLRDALAAEGWSNQRSGGAFGFTVGGQQENLAKTFEPLLKMGLTPEEIAPWSKTLRMGTTSPQELVKTLEQIPETAKILHRTMQEVSEGMQEFAAKTVEGGSTLLHGAQSYQGIAKLTGVNPAMTQALNEGPLGKAQAAQKGVLPWQVASLTPGAQARNAAETVKKLAEMAGNPAAVKTKNEYGETSEITSEAAKLAQMHMLAPEASNEYLKRMLELNKKLPGAKGTELGAAESGMTKATQLGTFIDQKKHENRKYGPYIPEATQAEHEWRREAAWQKQIEVNLKGSKKGDAGEEWNLETAKKNAEEKHHAMIAARGKAESAGTLNAQQEGNVIHDLPELYKRAREAGLGQHGEIKKWMTESPESQIANINAALAKKAEVEPEKDERAKAEIVMNANTEKWFKLQFPNAKSPNSPGAGGKSSASSAAQPSNESPSAMLASQIKQADQIRRGESSVGAK